MANLPTINDVNLVTLRHWIYNKLTEDALDGVYEDELADAMGVPYDASMPEPNRNATQEEIIEYNNFYDEQNENLYDLYYQALGLILEPVDELEMKEVE